MKYVYYLFLMSLFMSLPALSALNCPRSCDRPDNCRRQYFIGTKKIDFYSNFPLDQNNDCIEQVIFVVHGAERNAESRYDAVLDVAKSLDKEDRVLIISPFFKTLDDNPASNDFYWTSSGWKQGNTSSNSGKQISSFAVADEILDNVIHGGHFGFLAGVSITGHSAGGQYSQMYALTTAGPDENPNLGYQFLVLNPSNYTYLNTLRPHPSIEGYFEQPVYWTGSSWKMKPLYRTLAGSCPSEYNDYKYGLEERNSYASRFSSSTLIAQYLGREVYYFLGELDNDENDDALDTSCEAKLQGPNRLERGKNYYGFLSQYYGTHQHSIGVVAGVGHDARGMYSSEEVKSVLFDW